MSTQETGHRAHGERQLTGLAGCWHAIARTTLVGSLALAGCATAPPAKPPAPVERTLPPVVQAPKPEEPQVIPLGESRIGRPERLPERLSAPQPLPPVEGITTLPGIPDGRSAIPPAPPGAAGSAVTPSAPAIQAPPVAAPTNPVVVSMLTAADQYQQQGDLDRAASSVERGLRAAPHDAHLWHRLSRIRLQQGRYQQAEEMAKKSNSFAKGEKGLIVQNWLLIAEARQKMGDAAGASDARQRASSVSGGL